MKAAHVVLGVLWLVATAGFTARAAWAWWAVLACAAATLWYLPAGTAIGIIEVALFFLPSLRQGGGAA